MRRMILIMVVIVTCVIAPSGTGFGDETYRFGRVAKAQPDECFTGYGRPWRPIEHCAMPAVAGEIHVPKRNQTYPWGMVRSGDTIWIGTAANVAFMARAAAGIEEKLYVPGQIVIEGDDSQYPVDANRPWISSLIEGTLGDWRPPEVWTYNVLTGVQSRVRFRAPELDQTIGLRAAAAREGVVLMAGPRAALSGLVVYAFDSGTRAYLGARVFPNYGDIRSFVSVGGATYTGVKTRNGDGVVLRWRGTRANPFVFDTIVRLDNDAANLVFHDGRLFVGTWGNTALSGLAAPAETLADSLHGASPSAIWMSPPLRVDGRFYAGSWRRVWTVNQYEPDPVIAKAYGIGSMASFDGCLYWGTMNQPFSGYTALVNEYGAEIEWREAEAKHFSARFFSVFRMCGSDPRAVELLYGESRLARYIPSSIGCDGRWVMAPNSMRGRAPTFGPSGFGRPGSYYIWSSVVFDKKLFMGTMEALIPGGRVDNRGANLWSFADHRAPAELVHDGGLTTPFNEGVRNMIVVEDSLYIGLTNGANLSPDGGWEVVRLGRASAAR